MAQQWYTKDGKVCQDVFATVRSIQTNQQVLRRNLQRNMRLYGSTIQSSFGAQSYVTIDDFSDRMNINVCASLVDTVYNKISKNKPRIQFLTEAGSFENQQTAKKLTKFTDGQFYATKIYEHMPSVFKDALINGTGFLKIYKEGADIKCERTFTGEIIADELEGIYGEVKTLYQVKLIPKNILETMFPKFKTEIRNAAVFGSSVGLAKVSEMIWVVEAWRLQNGDQEGKHCICIENADLINEVYTKNYFPFVKLDWKKRQLGYMAGGLIDDVYPIQLEITRVCRKIQQIFHLLGVPRIFLEYGAEIIKNQMTNEIGSMVYYSGQPPIIAPGNALDPALFQYLQWLIQSAYEQPGISQLSAQSKKPSDLASGKALRVYNDIESERFFKASEAYESAFLSAATIMIDLAKDIANEYGEFEVMAKNNESFEMIAWKDIRPDKMKYVMQPYPVSFFSKTPSGQIQDAADLMSIGVIDQKTAAKLFDFPDVKDVMKYMNAAQDLIHKLADEIVYKGIYNSPEPFMDLNYAIKHMQTVYNESKINNVPEDRLEMLRTFISVSDNLIKQAQNDMMAKQQAMQIAAGQAGNAVV